MTRLWDDLEGVYLAGKYGLDRYLGSEPDGAFFRTTFGPDQRPAALKLIPASESANGDDQLALWRKVAALSHPNVLALLDYGRTEAAGEAFLYAVFEYPDDNLAGALANGPLSAQEVYDVMKAAEDATRYLHQRGLVHTAVDADHVVAVGDLIKLTTDSLRNSSDPGVDEDADLRGLESLRQHVRTGIKPEPPKAAPNAAISEPPAAKNGANGTGPKPIHDVAPPPLAAQPEKPVEPAVSRPAADAAAPPSLGLPIPKRAPALPLLVAAVGAVAIAIILAVTQRGTPDAPWTPVASAAPATPATAPHSNPVGGGVPAREPVAPPSPAPARPVSTAPAPERTAPVARHGENWRVIAYTYNHRDHAEHKVETINKMKLGFHAAVFAPRGTNQPPYFVSLGGRMSRDEAVDLQRKAKSKGLPRDTFIRNFSD